MSTDVLQRTWERPEQAVFEGHIVTLSRLDAEADADGLFAASHGQAGDEHIWRYLFNGPFASRDALCDWLHGVEATHDPLFYTVHDRRSGLCAGQISILNIVPDMGRAELGSIWYGQAFQHTRVNTESIYLLLGYLFDTLLYRRVEWKCNALNEPSRRAALRLGFSFEGLFRQHMVIKGHSRDTAWFAMMDHEWPSVKANFARYFASDALSLTTLNRPIIEQGATVRSLGDSSAPGRLAA